jgi:two-component system sensor histidine kinase PilS (NtrC family)
MGMVNGLILTFQDITEIRSMEESLRRSDRLAAVGRMAAGLAHEIRNPLGSMSSALQYLDENLERSNAEANLMDVVLREADRLNEIITDFLSYARLSADDSSKSKFEDFDVVEAIRDCFVLLTHSPEIGDTHSIHKNLPSAPVSITANKTQIKQVLWNLFQNSINAMPDGGTLNVSLTDRPGKDIHIVFEDTGCGMSSEKLEHLFEPFSNGSNGAGLGLFIAHKIIGDHGGQIFVESRENIGTKFTVALPH